MQIVIATPLYPPDIDETAVYAKELARRLAVEHTVTVVAYTHIGEQISGATTMTIEKDRPVFARIFSFWKAIRRAAHNAHVLYVINGASVELPVIVTSFTSRTPIIFTMHDTAAHYRAEKSWVLNTIEKIAIRLARAVIQSKALPKPEILPFKEISQNAWSLYEESWSTHIKDILTTAARIQ
jgi:hypothetical protein